MRCPSLLSTQVLGGDSGAVHPLAHFPHGGDHDPAHLAHLRRRLPRPPLRMEGRRLLRPRQHREAVPGELRGIVLGQLRRVGIKTTIVDNS